MNLNGTFGYSSAEFDQFSHFSDISSTYPTTPQYYSTVLSSGKSVENHSSIFSVVQPTTTSLPSLSSFTNAVSSGSAAHSFNDVSSSQQYQETSSLSNLNGDMGSSLLSTVNNSPLSSHFSQQTLSSTQLQTSSTTALVESLNLPREESSMVGVVSSTRMANSLFDTSSTNFEMLSTLNNTFITSQMTIPVLQTPSLTYLSPSPSLSSTVKATVHNYTFSSEVTTSSTKLSSYRSTTAASTVPLNVTTIDSTVERPTMSPHSVTKITNTTSSLSTGGSISSSSVEEKKSSRASTSFVSTTYSTSTIFPSSTESQIYNTSLTTSRVLRTRDPVAVVYTQTYEFTDSRTSFLTGIVTTATITGDATSTFDISTPTITKDTKLYQNWLNGGSLDNTGEPSASHSRITNKGAIIGGVIGGVCGILICSLLVWFVFKRRRRGRGERESCLKGSDVEGRFNTGSFSGGHRYYTGKNDSSMDSNPFRQEFNFNKPVVPPPRNGGVRASTLPHDNRFSLNSSLTGSSIGSTINSGSYSSMSSNSIRLGSDFEDNRNSAQLANGFLREII